VEGATAPEIPHDVDPTRRFQAGRDDRVANAEAILPPSEAVRHEMRKMELEAFEAGLLDTTGPAGETDFVERVKALEEEEKR
jgi:hypothetical protein